MRTYYRTPTYAAAGAIIGAPGGTFSLVYGFNPTGNAGYIQLFDTLVAPIAGDVPIESIQVGPMGTYSLNTQPPGRPVGALWFAVSSTGNNLTPSADAYWLACTFDT